MREIHFYESTPNEAVTRQFYHFWRDTEEAIKNLEPYIVTTQMGLMNLRLIDLGYRIFVHTNIGSYEIRLGNCEGTDKEIRRAHNIFKIWESGGFSIK